MATWNDVTTQAPELAARVEARFGAHKHIILATLRRDGSPRLCGIETLFALGDLWLGMMPESRKARDLQRDPRLALHSAPVDLELADGDATIGGRAVEITDPATFAAVEKASADAERAEAPPGPYHLFRVEVTNLSIVRVEGDHLVIDSWTEGEGVKRVERK
jgi:hypothetical protein